jgi:hypothetical protein
LPFEPFYPRKFSVASVSMYAPGQPGVYGLSNAKQWVFIGEADNIRTALLEQFDRGDEAIRRMNPTGFVFEVCPPGTRSVRRDRLIAEYSPACQVTKK